MIGIVSLVGAGPGDPELLTVKAARAIQNAQAVVYDRLVADSIVALIPAGVPTFFAGKSCKHKTMSQEEINSLLITLAKKGLRVVRLKGGDPLLFGRGGEEALALADTGIAFEIIPGITSAQGCGAYAGIPLTHRGLATGVRFLTGHRMTREEADDDLELDWKGLADPDTTLVIYMGLANLGAIAQKLMQHGMDKTTPAAAIHQGTTQDQILLLSSLECIGTEAEARKLEAPVLVIIGKVVSLANKLQWFKQEKTAQPSRKAK